MSSETITTTVEYDKTYPMITFHKIYLHMSDGYSLLIGIKIYDGNYSVKYPKTEIQYRYYQNNNDDESNEGNEIRMTKVVIETTMNSSNVITTLTQPSPDIFVSQEIHYKCAPPGTPNDLTLFLPNTNPAMCHWVKDGDEITWYPVSDRIKSIYAYRNGIISGDCKFWDSHGENEKSETIITIPDYNYIHSQVMLQQQH